MGNTQDSDPHDLNRFALAQSGCYEQALSEVRNGHKRSHWMWFIFPQIEGLGLSARSQHYAIRSLEEARAYLRHPVLGPRLTECMDAVLSVEGRSANAIFGSIDEMKLRSCATLFSCAAPDAAVFDQVLAKYFGGDRDPDTLRRLEEMG